MGWTGTGVAGVLILAILGAPPADAAATHASGPSGAVEPLVGHTVPSATSARPRQWAAAVRSHAVADGQFRTSGIRPRIPAESLRPWRQTTDEAYENVPRDADGVRMYPVGDVLYQHPVGQAQYGLVSLESFRRTGAPALLRRATAQADRLIRTHVESGGAWFFPYRFSFRLSRAGGLVMRAPWYSGMAQAEAVSLFVHLAQTPQVGPGQRAIYREAATRTFRSLTLGPASGKPWVSMVDGAGYLWLQEYPGTPPGRSDFTYNGHLFAILGLWDYWHLTGDPRAVRLIDGAATTALHYSSVVRRPGWASSYCAAHEAPTRKYHQIHVELLAQLQWLTGRAGFAARSEAFSTDYPDPRVGGQVQFAAGRHVGYTFTAGGDVTSRREVGIARASSAPSDERVRIRGRGIFYRISAGPLAGRFVRERPGSTALVGVRLRSVYDPARTAVVAAGTYRTVVFRADGRISRPNVTLRRSTSVAYDRSMLVDAVMRIHIAAGPLRDHWLPASARTG